MMNPADESALELAFAAATADGTVTVFSGAGRGGSLVTRRWRGADAALRVSDDALGSLKPIVTTTLLAAALRVKALPDLVLCGGHSVDRGSGTVPALLAEASGLASRHRCHPVRDPVRTVAGAAAAGAQGAAESEVTLPAILGLETGAASAPSLPNDAGQNTPRFRCTGWRNWVCHHRICTSRR